MSECLRCCPATCKCGCHGEGGKTKWISVKNRLPEKHEFILIAWDGEQYFPYDKIDRKTMTSQGKKSKITHWMPLPEPPEEKSPTE